MSLFDVFLLLQFGEMFWSIILGAIFSAIAGIATAWYSIKAHEKRETREEIYRPLYNELERVINVIKNEGLHLNYLTPFQRLRLDHYQRFRLDDQIKQGYDKYVNKIDEHDSFFKDLVERIVDKRRDMISSVKGVLPSELLLDGDLKLFGIDGKQKDSITIFQFLIDANFIEPLLSGKRGKELYDHVIKFGEQGGYKSSIEIWYRTNPNFFDDMVKALESLDDFGSEYRKRKDKVDEARSKVVEIAQKLKGCLETKIR